MHHVIYLSWATAPFSDQQLHDLLREARSHNTQYDVTGIMLYGNGCFVQVLEGEQATVSALYERIKQDGRHRDVTTFADKTIAQRAFGEWAMAFHHASPQQLAQVSGYLTPDQVQVDAKRLALADIHLIDLLRSFTLP
jgi:hypothetical protein